MSAFRRMSASRQKLPLAGSKSNFRFTPELGQIDAVGTSHLCLQARREQLPSARKALQFMRAAIGEF